VTDAWLAVNGASWAWRNPVTKLGDIKLPLCDLAIRVLENERVRMEIIFRERQRRSVLTKTKAKGASA